ncbi:MAG: nitroreductase family protein [Spirochaetales bacterium]|nr:nitroreductase family protein [Spirochaetales bacterium]
MMEEIIRKNRSYRRFREEERIKPDALRHWIDVARNIPQGGNLQPLKYILCTDPSVNGQVFTTLKWAAYFKEWGGPVQGERPAAYIVILGDTSIKKDFGCDSGIAAQTIMLLASEAGYGGCMIGSVNREGLKAILDIAPGYDILLVLAIGKPAEKIVVEEMEEGGSIHYYRDANYVHHVPKRPLKDIIVGEFHR